MVRDPRKDPAPGDLLRDEFGSMMVVSVAGAKVRFCRVHALSIFDSSIAEWRIYSVADEVLHVAD